MFAVLRETCVNSERRYEPVSKHRSREKADASKAWCDKYLRRIASGPEFYLVIGYGKDAPKPVRYAGPYREIRGLE